MSKHNRDRRKHKDRNERPTLFIVKAVSLRAGDEIIGWVRVDPLKTDGREGFIPLCEQQDTALILKNGIEILMSDFDLDKHEKLLFATKKEAEQDGIDRLRKAWKAGAVKPY